MRSSISHNGCSRFGGWFRFYNGVAYDAKVLRLSNKLYRFWTYCLCLASDNKGRIPPEADLIRLLPWKPSQIRTMLADLEKPWEGEEHGFLDRDEQGILRPHNWSNRQFQSDSSTERSRKHRIKRRLNVGQMADVHPMFIGQTSDAFVDNKHVAATCNVAATASEAEAETEYIDIAAAALETLGPAATKNLLPPPPPVQIPEPVHTPAVVHVPTPHDSLRGAEVVAACRPVTDLRGPLPPVLKETLLGILGNIPMEIFADRVKERGPYARSLGMLEGLARDAVEQYRSGWSPQPVLVRKPPLAQINNSVDYPEFRRNW